MASLALKLFPFLSWRERMTRLTLRADLLAGLVGALLVLPQGVAFATLAGMPPEYGLYGAMLPAVVGALWGSSSHLVSGPTNATSLMVFATVGALATPFSAGYVQLVLTLNLMIGVIKLVLGVARLGALVNFISTTVIIGFTAGAGLLIIAAQLRNFFGLGVAQDASFAGSVATFFTHVATIDIWTTAVGVVTLLAALAGRHLVSRIPYMLTGMIAGSAFAYALSRAGVAHVATIGALPSAFPVLSLPDFSAGTWRMLAPAALALTLIGLTEAVSSARAVAARSGERIDGNQEFIGQGLANIVGAFTSSYPTSGSFNRTGANFQAGARTPLAAVFSAGFLVVILLVVSPLAAFLPLAAMAALLFMVAWGLINFSMIRTTMRASRSETLVLAVTFLSVLSLQLEFAILIGVLCSLLVYLNRTAHPAVHEVAPDPASPQRPFVPVTDRAIVQCPQLTMVRIDGSLFFGATEHAHDALLRARAAAPAKKHLMLIGSGINFVDVSGAELLVREAQAQRERGGALYLSSLKPAVLAVMERGGFLEQIGAGNVFANKNEAIHAIYARLDSGTCRSCPARIFVECKTRLPDGSTRS